MIVLLRTAVSSSLPMPGSNAYTWSRRHGGVWGARRTTGAACPACAPAPPLSPKTGADAPASPAAAVVPAADVGTSSGAGVVPAGATGEGHAARASDVCDGRG